MNDFPVLPCTGYCQLNLKSHHSILDELESNGLVTTTKIMRGKKLTNMYTVTSEGISFYKNILDPYEKLISTGRIVNREVCHIVMKCPNVCQIGKEPATGLQPDNRFISSRSGIDLFLYACKRIHISEVCFKIKACI